MRDDDQEKDFLTRWSQRKRSQPDASEDADPASETEQEISEEEEAVLLANREAAEAIDLDTIDEDSDLSLFMKQGVPEALRKAALAKLWRSSPVFANVDGLVDYDDNFADPKLIMKTFTSAYKIGQGYLKKLQELQPEETSETDDIAVSTAPQEDETISPPDPAEVSTSTETTPELDEEVAPETAPDTSATASVSLRQRLGLTEETG